MTTKDKARERAKILKLVLCSNAEHFLMGHPKCTCVNCLAAALLEFRKETLEEAAKNAENNWGHIGRAIARDIRKMEE